MKSVTYRSVLLAVLMITSSLAGCLGDGADDADDTDVVDPIAVSYTHLTLPTRKLV